MNKISTPIQKKSKTLPKLSEKVTPKESTIAMLRMFARTYNQTNKGLTDVAYS